MKGQIEMWTILCLLSCTTILSAEVRTWKSADGKFSVEAELILANDTIVSLKKMDGTTIDVPLSQLSEGDRDFVKRTRPAVNAPAQAKQRVQPHLPKFTLKGHKSGVWCVAFSPRGNLLASGGGDVDIKKVSDPPGELLFWDTNKERGISPCRCRADE